MGWGRVVNQWIGLCEPVVVWVVVVRIVFVDEGIGRW